MPHYFINDSSEKKEYFLDAGVEGLKMTLKTSDGVFSKTAVDAGTGYLLRAVLPLLADGRKALADLGCGYGIIGVAAALAKPDYTVSMFDINENAVRLANINAGLNGVGSRAAGYVSDGLKLAGGSFDYVLTNPPFRAGKQTVLRFFNDSLYCLRPGGRLYAVLRKQQGAESYMKAVSEIFYSCGAILKKKGYVVSEAVKKDGVSEDKKLGE
jgi:16S rRNA (guanine1207-N2)-methyltransferase